MNKEEKNVILKSPKGKKHGFVAIDSIANSYLIAQAMCGTSSIGLPDHAVWIAHGIKIDDQHKPVVQDGLLLVKLTSGNWNVYSRTWHRTDIESETQPALEKIGGLIICKTDTKTLIGLSNRKDFVEVDQSAIIDEFKGNALVTQGTSDSLECFVVMKGYVNNIDSPQAQVKGNLENLDPVKPWEKIGDILVLHYKDNAGYQVMGLDRKFDHRLSALQKDVSVEVATFEDIFLLLKLKSGEYHIHYLNTKDDVVICTKFDLNNDKPTSLVGGLRILNCSESGMYRLYIKQRSVQKFTLPVQITNFKVTDGGVLLKSRYGTYAHYDSKNGTLSDWQYELEDT